MTDAYGQGGRHGGWGDKGFFKGGAQGPGNQNETSALSTSNGFGPLRHQKEDAGAHFEQRAEDMNTDGSPPPSGATCETEDHSFMNHKPGCSGGLPGVGKAKTVLETLHGQGR